MVAMATMVASFRASVDDWLARVLPADLYVRAAPVASGIASSARFSSADLQRMASHPGVVRVETARNLRLVLDAARPSITLLARRIDRDDPARTLPLTGARVAPRAGLPAVYVSEALVDLYDARPGTTLRLPLAGRAIEVAVAGVWRDYARQFGSVVMDIDDYERITGDSARTDASLWLRDGTRAADVARELAGQLDARSAEFAEPGEIRAVSLRIFDRSFAVTYLLEFAAIVDRPHRHRRDLRCAGDRAHRGVRHAAPPRRDARRGAAPARVRRLLITAIGARHRDWLPAGGSPGCWWTIVNPQSFHWTMDLRLPLPLIATLLLALLGAAALTAAIAGRHATARSAVLAVREDF